MDPRHRGRIDDIEALRAFAVIFTIAGHVKYLFPWGNDKLQTLDLYFGLWTGVDLFFAISGFVIARDLLRRLDAANSQEAFWRSCFAFWIRRVYRIWPTSWLWVLVIITLSVVFSGSHEFGHLTNHLSDFSAVVMQVANFHFWHCQVNHLDECGGAAPWWSLSLEEQFYIALPIMVFAFRKRLPWVLGALVAIQIFIPRQVWSLLWVVRTDAICLGVLLAIFSRNQLYKVIEPTFMAKARYSIPVVALLIFLLADLPSNWDGKINPVPFSTGMVAIVSAMLVYIASYGKGYIASNRFAKAVLLWVGARSYALYLIHGLTMYVTMGVWRHIEPHGTVFGPNYTLRYFVTWVVMTLVLVELNYRFIEVPIRRKGKEIARKMEEGGSAKAPTRQSYASVSERAAHESSH